MCHAASPGPGALHAGPGARLLPERPALATHCKDGFNHEGVAGAILGVEVDRGHDKGQEQGVAVVGVADVESGVLCQPPYRLHIARHIAAGLRVCVWGSDLRAWPG